MRLLGLVELLEIPPSGSLAVEYLVERVSDDGREDLCEVQHRKGVVNGPQLMVLLARGCEVDEGCFGASPARRSASSLWLGWSTTPWLWHLILRDWYAYAPYGCSRRDSVG